MTRSLCRLALLAVVLVLVVPLAACSDEAPKRLSDSLAQVGIKDVTVDEQKISATCSQGDKIEVPTAELERNFLGMSDPKKVVSIAKGIAKDCEEKDNVKRREESQKARLTDTLKALGIDAAGLDDAAAKKAICAKLTEKLPRKEPDRLQEAAKNTREWSCDPPPALADLPGGLWEVSKGDAKKPWSARLRNDAGDVIAVRCSGAGKAAKPEIYVSLADKAKVKKGTKFAMATLDAKKPAKWKANLAKDLSAIFFDPKMALKPLLAAQKLSVDVPTAKRTQKVGFELKGVGEAVKDFPPACR